MNRMSLQREEQTDVGYGYKTNLLSRVTMTGFEGYAAVFGVKDLGNDIIERGAFSKSILERGGRVPLFWNHDPCYTAGQIHCLIEDDYGLLVKGHLDMRLLDTPSPLTGLSIGYRTVNAQELPGVRILNEIDLWEVSLVRFPMGPKCRFGTTEDIRGDAYKPRKAKKPRKPTNRELIERDEGYP